MVKFQPIWFTGCRLVVLRWTLNLVRFSFWENRQWKWCIVFLVMQTPFSSENSTYCNKPWQTFFDGTGISPNELWFGVVSAVYISLRIAHLRLSGRLGLCCFELRYGSKCFRQTVPQCNWRRCWPCLFPVGGFSFLDAVNLCSLGFWGVSLLGSVHTWCPDTVPKYGTVNTTSFCADTQALVPGHQVWTAPYLGYIVMQQQPTAKRVCFVSSINKFHNLLSA